MKRTIVPILLTLSLAAAALRADVVLTQDGGRITGTITAIDDESIALETAYAGSIRIQREAVVGIETESPIFVRLQSGTTLAGKVSLQSDGKIRVDGEDATLTTRLESVQESWPQGASDPMQARAEAQVAKLQRSWTYEVSADINGKEGNSEEFNTGLSFDARLKGPNDELRFYGAYERSESNGVKTDDEQIVGTRYTSYFHDKLGWYVRQELESDEFENIDLRSITAGGLSYRWHDTDDFRLVGRSGLSYRYESFSTGGDEQLWGLDFGLEHFWRFAAWGSMRNDLTFTPAVEDFSNYRAVQDSSLEFPLGTSDKWSLRMGLKNEYDSEPDAGLDELDTTYYTKFVLRFK